MIMRRAMRFGRTAGVTQPILVELASAVIDAMESVSPALAPQRAFIQAAARHEEERFAQTLTSGLARLEDLIASVRAGGGGVLPGEEVFRLYDTYGFPLEMTRDVARERGVEVDEPGFARAMEVQRGRARAAHAFAVANDEQRFAQLLHEGVTTEFIGYTQHRARAKVVALFTDGHRVSDAAEGARVAVVLDRTPFYPEGGGQVGDTGVLRAATAAVEISDTRRPAAGVIVHHGTVVRGRVRVGQSVRAEIDRIRRWDIMRNHTATHLLHKALREALGEHTRQAGSLVAPDRLRFDFLHLAPLTSPEREAIEQRVNEQILADLVVRARWMRHDDALAAGAMALFGEKYGEQVRVISISDYSRELCGGTHLSRTSQIGLFKITAEGGVAAGVRRIEAVTGWGVYRLATRLDTVLRTLSERLGVGPEDLPDRVRRLEERVKELERTLLERRDGVASGQLERIYQGAIALASGLKVVSGIVDASDPRLLRADADWFRDTFTRNREEGVAVVVSRDGRFVVSSNTTAVNSGRLAATLAREFGGRGGGPRPSGSGWAQRSRAGS